MPAIWTLDLVCECLVSAFRLRPGLPVNAAWPNPPIATIAEVEVEMNWQRRFLPDDPDGWRYLRTWAQCKATGDAITPRIKGRGWSRKSFENGWRRAAAVIAKGLNAERVNTAALLAGEAAEARLERNGVISVPSAAPAFVKLDKGKDAVRPNASQNRGIA